MIHSVDLGNVTAQTVTDGDIGTEYAITNDTSLDGTDDQVDNLSWYNCKISSNNIIKR